MLNKRSEIINRCRHNDKHQLPHQPQSPYTTPTCLATLTTNHLIDQQHTLTDLEPVQQHIAQLTKHVLPHDQQLNVHDPEPVPEHIAQLPSQDVHSPNLTLPDPGPFTENRTFCYL